MHDLLQTLLGGEVEVEVEVEEEVAIGRMVGSVTLLDYRTYRREVLVEVWETSGLNSPHTPPTMTPPILLSLQMHLLHHLL